MTKIKMNKVPELTSMIEDGRAYVKDGHVLCYANVAPAASHDYNLAPHFKENESDVLLWKPYTALGLKAKDCVDSAWGPGFPTCNI